MSSSYGPSSQTIWSKAENKFLIGLEFSDNSGSLPMVWSLVWSGSHVSPRSHLELVFSWLTILELSFLNSNMRGFFLNLSLFFLILFPLCRMSCSKIANYMVSSLVSFKTPAKMAVSPSLMAFHSWSVAFCFIVLIAVIMFSCLALFSTTLSSSYPFFVEYMLHEGKYTSRFIHCCIPSNWCNSCHVVDAW